MTSEGTIYPLLTRLRKEALVTTFWQESASGPPRRYYRLTDAGGAALAAFSADWARFRDGVDALLTPEEGMTTMRRDPLVDDYLRRWRRPRPTCRATGGRSWSARSRSTSTPRWPRAATTRLRCATCSSGSARRRRSPRRPPRRRRRSAERGPLETAALIVLCLSFLVPRRSAT